MGVSCEKSPLLSTRSGPAEACSFRSSLQLLRAKNNTKINRGLQQHTDYESIIIERVALLDSSMDLTKLVVRLFLLFFSAVTSVY